MASIYKYEVAFSFHSKDEALAQRLSDLLSDRVSTFIYSEQQKVLAGRDGEVVFNAVFGLEARIVVVLHREEWGHTPFTRIEQTAIRNRAYNEGYDFTVFIPTDGKGVPDWVPKTQLYVGLERWGVEAAAANIEAAVQRVGGDVRTESPSERAARLQRTINFREAREDFHRSHAGVVAAKQGWPTLENELTQQITDIAESSLRGLTIRKHLGEYLLIHGVGRLWMTLLWHQPYSNVLSDSYLRVELLNGPPRLPNLTVFDDPVRLSSQLFDYALFETGESGYAGRGKSGRQFTPKAFSEYLLKMYMDAAQSLK